MRGLANAISDLSELDLLVKRRSFKVCMSDFLTMSCMDGDRSVDGNGRIFKHVLAFVVEVRRADGPSWLVVSDGQGSR